MGEHIIMEYFFPRLTIIFNELDSIFVEDPGAVGRLEAELVLRNPDDGLVDLNHVQVHLK